VGRLHNGDGFNVMSDPVPFGGWSPILSGIIPSMPPPALLEPPAILVEYSYQQLKHYRMVSQPVIVQVHYDMVQEMIEDRIREMQRTEHEAWLQWCARMM
jgi:hypothetical protein